MKAAVVRVGGEPPEFGEFEAPTPRADEVRVAVGASAVSRITYSRAMGRHYSAEEAPPFVAGVDGVGRTDDGRMVYFTLPRPPFGALAEWSVAPASNVVPLPDGLDPVVAAAAAIPGMSCWVPLTVHAPIPPGGSVLVNGATGTSGRMAVQVAKHLGARRVIATGREGPRLRQLTDVGADVVLPLGMERDALHERIRAEARDSGLAVVLDYLWGSSAQTILAALGTPPAPRRSERIRYVEVGAVSAADITLDGALLRASGIELIGTGVGSTPPSVLLRGIGEFLRALAAERFRIDFEAIPLAEIGSSWNRALGERRLVYTIPSSAPR